MSMAETFCGADDVTYRIGRQYLIKISVALVSVTGFKTAAV